MTGISDILGFNFVVIGSFTYICMSVFKTMFQRFDISFQCFAFQNANIGCVSVLRFGAAFRVAFWRAP